MKFDKHKILGGLIIASTYPPASLAADMFSDPTQVGTPGKFDIQIGGGKSANLALDLSKSTGTLQIGTVSGLQQMSASSGKLSEDQVFIGISYAFNAHSQLFANLGTGKDSGQQSSSRALGIKISPDTKATEVKMGLMLRAQQVTTNIDGLVNLGAYSQINDGVNLYQVNTPINGTEQIKYTRLDAFFGASSSTGMIRPYGGLCLTRISGTDTVSLNDTASISSWPINPGFGGTTSNQHVSFNVQSDISGSKYFTGVLGLVINPDGDLGMTAELQGGVQNSIMLAGNIRF